MQDYLRLVEASHRERSQLLASLLVGYTRFFRDTEVFTALHHAWVRRPSRQGEPAPLRAWTAGCATGEEAYSLAIVLHEANAELGLRRPTRIFATDIREEAL
ncbi:MAG TPA: CheR family methyltransferase, partial [Polyangiaceae bacterium]|nr:CheR family methyltransferase [Polyangiaceae bacterium]